MDSTNKKESWEAKDSNSGPVSRTDGAGGQGLTDDTAGWYPTTGEGLGDGAGVAAPEESPPPAARPPQLFAPRRPLGPLPAGIGDALALISASEQAARARDVHPLLAAAGICGRPLPSSRVFDCTLLAGHNGDCALRCLSVDRETGCRCELAERHQRLHTATAANGDRHGWADAVHVDATAVTLAREAGALVRELEVHGRRLREARKRNQDTRDRLRAVEGGRRKAEARVVVVQARVTELELAVRRATAERDAATTEREAGDTAITNLLAEVDRVRQVLGHLVTTIDLRELAEGGGSRWAAEREYQQALDAARAEV